VAAYRALPSSHLSDEYAALLADVARRAAEAEVLVAIDGELVGCVTFVPDGSSPWAELLEESEAGIRMLAVLPIAQGRGIGRALLDACVSRARQLERGALLLHTTPWMSVAQHLYETASFERFPERDWSPVPEVTLLAYRLLARLRALSGRHVPAGLTAGAHRSGQQGGQLLEGAGWPAAASADSSDRPTTTRQRHRTSHEGDQVDRSKTFPRWRHTRSPLALESSNCSSVPPVRIQQVPCSPAPARMAYSGLGRLGEPAHGTAGVLAQGTALHGCSRILAK